MADTWTLTLGDPDRYGREQSRTVNLTIDIRDFKDKAGFAYLVMAANPHLSVRDTQAVLASVSEQHERPVGWISRRRWLFHGTGKAGAKPNADDKDQAARRIMEGNPRLSARQMVYRLRDAGIDRSREWIRQNRCG